MNQRIHIIYSKNPGEIANLGSALGSYIYVLGGILQENGYSIHINGEAYKTIKRGGFPTNQNTLTPSLLKSLIPAVFKRVVKDLRLLIANNQFIKRVKTTETDLIIEFYSYGSTAGCELALEKNAPLIVVYDAPVIDEYKLFNNTAPFFLKEVNCREKQTLLKATFTVVYSNAVKKYVWEKIAKKTAIEIHQNIDFSRFDFIEEKKMGETLNIGFIGSFLKWHRVDLLLNVFTKLKSEGYDLHLYLLGMGEKYSEIREEVALNKYKNNITMPGFSDGAELLNFKKKMHIGVMPGSNWYGAPNKIFEYGASRMAVVAPDTPTIQDLFTDKSDVLLFENGSEDGLYTALKQLCENQQQIPLLAENLYQKIRTNYSKNHTFAFYNQLIKKAIQ